MSAEDMHPDLLLGGFFRCVADGAVGYIEEKIAQATGRAKTLAGFGLLSRLFFRLNYLGDRQSGPSQPSYLYSTYAIQDFGKEIRQLPVAYSDNSW